MAHRQSLAIFCPLQGVIDIVSKKWALLVVYEIGNHKRIRFNALRSELKGITAKSLTNTLNDLLENKLISKQIFNEIPPRVEYSLTQDGKELHRTIIPMIQWAASRRGAIVNKCSCKAKPKNMGF